MASDRPNILFLMSDQHNAHCLGSYGHEAVQTPNLDALAARGVRLTSAFAQNPICTPARVCALSGLYAHNTGRYGLYGPNLNWLPSMFSHFRQQGYHTGAIGKLHTPVGWIEAHADSVRDTVLPPGGNHYAAYLAENAIAADDGRLRLTGWTGRGQGIDAEPAKIPKELSKEGFCAAKGREFLSARPKDKPFFLWYTTCKPHQMYTPAPEFWNLYDEDLPLPPNAEDDCVGRPRHVRSRLERLRAPDCPHWVIEPRNYDAARKRVLRGYYGNVTQMDWAMGQLLQGLREEGLEENTLVVYVSDHGDFAGEHGMIEKAPGIGFDCITRVPMIWRWPGRLPDNGVRDQLVEQVDIFPTLCALAGIPPLQMFDGHDLADILINDGGDVREAAFTENPLTKAVHTRRWNYVHWQQPMFPDLEEPIGELYDRQNDPWEKTNLFADPKHLPVVRDMQRILLNWMIGSAHPTTLQPSPLVSREEPSRGSPSEPLPEDGRFSPRRVLEHGRKWNAYM